MQFIYPTSLFEHKECLSSFQCVENEKLNKWKKIFSSDFFFLTLNWLDISNQDFRLFQEDAAD